jgi:hypothetical protein
VLETLGLHTESRIVSMNKRVLALSITSLESRNKGIKNRDALDCSVQEDADVSVSICNICNPTIPQVFKISRQFSYKRSHQVIGFTHNSRFELVRILFVLDAKKFLLIEHAIVYDLRLNKPKIHQRILLTIHY